MDIRITKPIQGGTISAIASKSEAHRLLVCAALADGETFVSCPTRSEDIDATARCLEALGATARYARQGYRVRPIARQHGARHGASQGAHKGASQGAHKSARIVLDCGESGSTLRFLLPVCCALGVRASFHMGGRLPARPLSALYDELASHGCALSEPGRSTLDCDGRLESGEYALPGNISSQYVSGLLLALPLLAGDSLVRVAGVLESRPYVDMTLDALLLFGVAAMEEEEEEGAERPGGTEDEAAKEVKEEEAAAVAAKEEGQGAEGPGRAEDERGAEGPGRAERAGGRLAFRIPGGQAFRSPGHAHVGGDWSNAAFWLCAGAIGRGRVACSGLDTGSRQGDRAIAGLLARFGARVCCENGTASASRVALRGICIDASDTPDLVPALAAVASVAEGRTVIRNAGRLRIKESDRLRTVARSLSDLGADVAETEDGLSIIGKKGLPGGETRSFGDHRIAMAAAILSAACSGPVVVRDAEAVQKSYPGFFGDFAALGGACEEA